MRRKSCGAFSQRGAQVYVSDSERTVSLPDELGEYRDLLGGGPADKSCLRLPAGGFLWLICDFTTD